MTSSKESRPFLKHRKDHGLRAAYDFGEGDVAITDDGKHHRIKEIQLRGSEAVLAYVTVVTVEGKTIPGEDVKTYYRPSAMPVKP